MKNVTLVKFNTEQTIVADYTNRMDYHTTDLCNDRWQNVAHTSEICYQDEIEIEVLPIQTIVNKGVEHYIAVEPKVFEYLYLIENPVTGKTQVDKIKSLHEKLGYMTIERNLKRVELCKQLARRNKLHNSWWQRVIFLFKGGNYE